MNYIDKNTLIRLIRKLFPQLFPHVDSFKATLKSYLPKKIPLSCKECTFYFYKEENLFLGKNIQLNNAFLDLHGKIVIDDNVFFGHEVKVLTGYHNINLFGKDRKKTVLNKDVIIEKGAWIASYAILLPGAYIGKNSVVAAGSVVHGRVEPYSLVAGSPAKHVRFLKQHLS